MRHVTWPCAQCHRNSEPTLTSATGLRRWGVSSGQWSSSHTQQKPSHIVHDRSREGPFIISTARSRSVVEDWTEALRPLTLVFIPRISDHISVTARRATVIPCDPRSSKSFN